MHIFLALLYVSVVAAPQSSSLPTKGDSIGNTINSILSIAQTTLVHIKKLRTKVLFTRSQRCHTFTPVWFLLSLSIHIVLFTRTYSTVHSSSQLPAAPQIEDSTPSIEGLTGIIHYLGVLDDELQSASTELLGQIQADVSSLNGRLYSLPHATGCAVQDRPAGQLGDSLFPESRLYLTLTKVQSYLEKFLLHKDKLKVCWETKSCQKGWTQTRLAPPAFIHDKHQNKIVKGSSDLLLRHQN